MAVIAVEGAGGACHRATVGNGVGVSLGGLGFAVMVRGLVAGQQGASSVPAAVLFAVLMGLLVALLGWRPGRFRWTAVFIGLGGGAALVIGPMAAHGTVSLTSGVGAGAAGVWAVVVSMVAITEEVFFRGLLWTALERRWSSVAALFATTVVFALVHVPLYGWRAMPLDVGVGLGLGALRIWSGGVTAPAVAHLVADVAGGFL